MIVTCFTFSVQVQTMTLYWTLNWEIKGLICISLKKMKKLLLAFKTTFLFRRRRKRVSIYFFHGACRTWGLYYLYFWFLFFLWFPGMSLPTIHINLQAYSLAHDNTFDPSVSQPEYHCCHFFACKRLRNIVLYNIVLYRTYIILHLYKNLLWHYWTT